MVEESSPHYKQLFLEAEERLLQEEERLLQAKRLCLQTEDRARRATAKIQSTNFAELIRHSHDFISRHLSAATPSRSTTGAIPLPTGKYCPTRLEHWADCSSQQSEIYRSVYKYLQSAPETAPRMFSSISALEHTGRQFAHTPISSERELMFLERTAVEIHVLDIIGQLCKLPAARAEFGLRDGLEVGYHVNFLGKDDLMDDSVESRPSRDSLCIHRLDADTTSVLTSAGYRVPHMLSVEALRLGLRPMDLWQDMVRSNRIPTDPEAKAQFQASRLVCSAIVKEYHMMIQEGLEYSYLTTGITRVLLHVPYESPTTLYYFLCDPNNELDPELEESFQQPKTSIARVLCLWLTACRSTPRDQEWRNSVLPRLHVWETGFDDTGSQAQKAELEQTPCDSNNTTKRHTSLAAMIHHEASDNQGFSQYRDGKFCTLKCLRGLQTGGLLDHSCPKVKLHRRGKDDTKHSTTSTDLLRSIKRQLDENIDRCILYGSRGSYGAPFKLTCATYGYAVLGKGTTSHLWKQVSREAEVYQILRKAQARAVPVFLGVLNLSRIYFLHEAGEIRHMLVMGWGGESTAEMEMTPELLGHIHKARREIKALGIVHDDLRDENVLWNEELRRALIIDFHRSTLIPRPLVKRSRPDRKLLRPESRDTKRPRIV
ncbi:unnamed protein product [Penicillium olsonii]|nr:unnamed protein product [Penicillium olsonii]